VNAVTVSSVTYRIGIHQYQQPLEVSLASTDLNRETGGSGGCDAGLGIAGLAVLALFGTVPASKRGKAEADKPQN
jgi:hypothetical protein